MDLFTHAKSKAQWAAHQAAAAPAKQAGACWQCCAEVGCRATDGPDEKCKRFLMHPECIRRIDKRTR